MTSREKYAIRPPASASRLGIMRACGALRILSSASISNISSRASCTLLNAYSAFSDGPSNSLLDTIVRPWQTPCSASCLANGDSAAIIPSNSLTSDSGISKFICIPCRCRLFQKKFDGQVDDGRLDDVPAVELHILDVIAGGFQLGGIGTASGGDRQLLIHQSVRDEYFGAAFLHEDSHEAARERHHVRDDVAVGDAV